MLPVVAQNVNDEHYTNVLVPIHETLPVLRAQYYEDVRPQADEGTADQPDADQMWYNPH